MEQQKANITKLEEDIQKQKEAFVLKQTDLENKVIQERLKVDQKSKDYSKLGISSM